MKSCKIFLGGGCINDTVIHLVIDFLLEALTGMGAYHGKLSFDIFS
jgi:hypothetical protein